MSIYNRLLKVRSQFFREVLENAWNGKLGDVPDVKRLFILAEPKGLGLRF